MFFLKKSINELIACQRVLTLPNFAKKELQTLADGADEGIIVFTLGSAIPVSSMPENLVKMFAKVFARIPQQVFWKWEQSSTLMENLSDNVKIVKWLPQQDLLGNFNCTQTESLEWNSNLLL